MCAASITPYEQGNLDWLCGIYSIINAIALAAARARGNNIRLGKLKGNIAHAGIDELFAALTAGTPGLRRRTGWAVINGLDSVEVASLIGVASRWLTARYRLRLAIQRPFYRSAKMSPKNLARVIQKASQEGAAVIIEGRGRWNHWSVAINVNKRGIKLFDSSRYTLVFWKRQRGGRAPSFDLLVPRSVIIIRVGPADQLNAALP